ncbi:proline-rich protein 18 [Parus major]|uniref:proline-rich protein 18 n=1 Tax=Parus major TaxID=9157 RepID=UPI0014443002|nr:proline-rich protein 18 [Parus major]
MGLQPRRAAGPCPPAGRSAALPGARSAPPWARSDEPEGTPGRPATLPPLLPAILPTPSASPAAARAQPKKPPPAASAPKKAAPRPSEEKAARKPAPSPAGRAAPARRGDLRALLKVSLLNDRHRYDDEEYEEEEAGAAADEGLVRKCTEWLRGVESAAGRDHPDRLETLPHLGTL